MRWFNLERRSSSGSSLKETALSGDVFTRRCISPSSKYRFCSEPNISISIREEPLYDRQIDLVPRLAPLGSRRNAEQKSRLGAPQQQLI